MDAEEQMKKGSFEPNRFHFIPKLELPLVFVLSSPPQELEARLSSVPCRVQEVKFRI